MRMKSLWAFITQMDSGAVRALSIMLAMFCVVVIMIVIGRDMLVLPESDFHKFFVYVRESRWGLPATILTFVVAAFLGVPQWALLAGVILAFGPYIGGLYAWLGTLISACTGFWLGRWMGAERMQRYGGDFANRLIKAVRKNGFVTSFVVRFVPTGPFVLVNMTAGVSGMKFWAFLLGTGLGIIPKVIVVALVAKGLLSGAEGRSIMALFIGLAVILIAGMFVARKRLRV